MRVIIKADDFWLGERKDAGWDTLFRVAVEQEIKISVGIIGESLIDPTPEAVAFIVGQVGVQLFNHSFYHVNLGKGRLKEFWHTSKTYQENSINNTQEMARDKLGVVMETIGFPANASDETTVEIMKAHPDIDYIYQTPSAYNFAEMATTGKRMVPITVSLNHFDEVAQAEIGEADPQVLQIHPSMWNGKDIAEFEAMIIKLRDAGHQFIWPNEI